MNVWNTCQRIGGESNCGEYTKQVCQRKRKRVCNGALGVLDDRYECALVGSAR